jgi:hypothetical protein
VLIVIVLEELKYAVTPAGTPETPRLTLLTSPTGLATLMMLASLLPPTRRVRLLADDERSKLGTGMVNAMLVLLDRFPEVPVTVTV